MPTIRLPYRALALALGALSVTSLGAQSAPAAAPVSGPAAAPSRAVLARIVDSLASDAVAASRISSVSVAVVRGSDTVYLKAVGLANRETNTPSDANRVYRLGSITKQFTAAIILQLVAEGKLSLADTVGTLLPWAPAAWRGVTLPMLLNHTSGIPSYTNIGMPWVTRWGQDLSPDTLISLTANMPLDFAPGTRWRYNNTGYVILGSIIERLEGKPYAQVVENRIAKPFGLTSLRYCPTDPDPSRDALPYDNAPNKTFRPSTRLSLTHPHAAGALCSTARDLVKWNSVLHGGKIVRADLYQRMITPEGGAVQSNYGFGIGHRTTNGREVLSHNGGIPGFSTNGNYFPADRLSVIVLGNTATGEVDKLAAQIVRAATGAPLVQRPKRIDVTPEQIALLVGKYEVNVGARTMKFDVRAGTNALLIQPEGQPQLISVAIAPLTFMTEVDENIQFEFVVENGKATGMTLIQGQRFPGKRLPD